MSNEITIDDIDDGNGIGEDENDKQAIDLTEIIKYDKQKKVMEMTDGMESYIRGNGLSSSVIKYLKIQLNSGVSDPTGGIYNNRFGGEGFFTTVMDGIKSGIIYIINLIKKIVMWCVDKIKTLFGYGNSERQAEVLAEKLPALKEEMKSYLLGLGFPAHILDLDKFIGTLPAERRRIDQFKCLTYKLKDKEKIISDIKELLPMSSEVVSSLAAGINKATRVKGKYDKLLEKIRVDLRHGFVQNNIGYELLLTTQEIIKASDVSDQVNKIAVMMNKIAGLDVDDEAIKTKFVEINQKLNAETVQATFHMDSEAIKATEQMIGFYTGLRLLPKDRAELTGNMQELVQLAQLGDFETIQAIATITGNNEYILSYQSMMTHLNAYANFAKMSIQVAKDARRTFDELTSWYGSAYTFMLEMIYSDLKMMKFHLAQAMKEWDNKNKMAARRGQPSNGPFPIELSQYGLPKNLALLDEAEAQTIMEKIAQGTREIIELNDDKFGKMISNFKRETGF